ncbi:IPT/TIG domain-containing protein [Streptomyces sp. NBC_01190]|uniref:IPT/TIG domain-containing protein n=1 Tax=Streptomyces sp. NBC_01190 TaxID=2903767 RepID=UPI003865F1C8|nr:IPT/TIG domain-containing protein [Streptomyces sp. NBC_01190]
MSALHPPLVAEHPPRRRPPRRHGAPRLSRPAQGRHPGAVPPAGPPLSPTAGVTVTTPGGSAEPANFYYLTPPVAATAAPTSGPLAGGTPVTVTGTVLQGATSVTSVGTPGIITTNTASTIAVTTPAGAATGPALIIVTTPGGVTDNLTITYTAAPTITSVLPVTGTTAGGKVVAITGTNLDTVTRVIFGANTAPFLAALTSTQLAVVTPPAPWAWSTSPSPTPSRAPPLSWRTPICCERAGPRGASPSGALRRPAAGRAAGLRRGRHRPGPGGCGRGDPG